MDDNPCPYDFGIEHLQALWFEFQSDDEATCPLTGAVIALELARENDTAAPTVRARCSRCGRRATFQPEEVEGFRWAE